MTFVLRVKQPPLNPRNGGVETIVFIKKYPTIQMKFYNIHANDGEIRKVERLTITTCAVQPTEVSCGVRRPGRFWRLWFSEGPSIWLCELGHFGFNEWLSSRCSSRISPNRFPLPWERARVRGFRFGTLKSQAWPTAAHPDYGQIPECQS